jgi:hypothetical protein
MSAKYVTQEEEKLLDMVSDQPGISTHVPQNDSADMPAKAQHLPIPTTVNAGITAWGQVTLLTVL